MPLSASTAETIYNVARILILLATIFGVTGTVGLFWAGNSRDQHRSEEFKQEVEESLKAALRWEGEATLAQKEIARLKNATAPAPAASASSEASIAKPAPADPRVSYPVLTDAQKEIIIQRLKFLAKVPVRIGWRAADSTAKNYGETLVKVLADAGYVVTPVSNNDQSNGPGLTLVVGRAETPPDSALELLGVLSEVGAPIRGIAANLDTMTDIYLEVGPENPASQTP